MEYYQRLFQRTTWKDRSSESHPRHMFAKLMKPPSATSVILRFPKEGPKPPVLAGPFGVLARNTRGEVETFSRLGLPKHVASASSLFSNIDSTF